MRTLLLAALLLSGCTLLAEPEQRSLEGPTDGHQPTPAYLKVFVRRDDGTLALLGFDRRDWHVAEIVRRLDHRELAYLGATVLPRATLNEYVVERVETPVELQALRYDDMGASPEARAEMDSEYEAILDAILPLEALPALPADATRPASALA